MAVNRSAAVRELDAAVSAVQSDAVYGQVARARGGSAAERREARRQQARNRFQVDLPVELERELRKMAEAESVPVSQMMCYLMLAGMKAIEAGLVQAPGLAKKASRSMRFEYVLDFGEFENEGVR